MNDTTYRNISIGNKRFKILNVAQINKSKIHKINIFKSNLISVKKAVPLQLAINKRNCPAITFETTNVCEESILPEDVNVDFDENCDSIKIEEPDDIEVINAAAQTEQIKTNAQEIKAWAIRNNTPHAHLTDLLLTLNKIGVADLPETATALMQNEPEESNHMDNGRNNTSNFQQQTGTSQNFSEIMSNSSLMLERLSNLENCMIDLQRTQMNAWNQTIYISKSEFEAQTQLLRNNFLLTKQTFSNTKQILGIDFDSEEVQVSACLPLGSIEEIKDFENKLQVEETVQATNALLLKYKVNHLTLCNVFKQLVTDKCLIDFNWDGRCGRLALNNFTLFDKILCDVFKPLSRKEYDSQIRKAIELAHNREKQRKMTRKRLSLKTPVEGADQEI